MPRTSSKTKSKPGFSNRLNQLLTWAGYEQRGRASALSKRIDQSRVVIHSWLTKDIVPVNLKEVIEILLDDCSSVASADSAVKWLLTADESKNPMDALTLQRFRNVDLLLLSRVFTTVYNVAVENDIELEGIPADHLNVIYSTLLKQASRSTKKQIDEAVIADLLDSAKSFT